jgi:small subunit ribosomal protein S6
LAEAREYELVLMLDPGQDAPARDAVAKEVKGQIEGAGTLKHENEWGLRKMAYEIAQRNEADYRWFRFEAPSELLEQLDHNLKIADGVLRFRIFKVGPETPVIAPPATAAPGPSASRERPAAPAPVEAETAEPAAAEPPAEAGEPAVAESDATEEQPVAENAGEEAATPQPETAAEPAAEAAEPVVAEATEEAPPEPAPAGEGDEPAEAPK